jgi:hypothetical protein
MYTPEYFAPVAELAIPVRLAARSFIIPIPQGIGSDIVYPEDVGDRPEQKKGQPILNKRGEPKGTGIVFKNLTDGAIQAARDDGREMIIVNALSSEQAGKLSAEFDRLIPDPVAATERQIRKILDFARDKLGVKDFYNGDRAKIANFEPEARHKTEPDCGIFIRRNPEERFAILGIGTRAFKGPASSPQTFTGSVVAVMNASHRWLVQTEEFERTYTHPNGCYVQRGELPAFRMSETLPPARMMSVGATQAPAAPIAKPGAA